jgi:hypothetical protein
MGSNITVTVTGGSSTSVIMGSAGSVMREVHIKEQLTPDGEATVFTLAYTPRANSVTLTLNGVTMTEGESEDFTVVGNEIHTTFAPESGDKLGVKYVKN